MEVKKIVEENERETAFIQLLGLQYKKYFSKGHELHYDDFFPLRPLNLNGIAPYRLNEIFG